MINKNILTIISILIFIGVLFLLDFPAYNRVAFLRSEVKNHRDFLKEKEELLIKINQLKTAYDTHRDELERVYYSLPSQKDIPGLIVQFEALASENGLVLEKLDFTESAAKAKQQLEEEIKPKGSYKTLTVLLSVTGSYQSFQSFITALEFNIRPMDIKSIDFSSSKKAAGAESFTFDINLETYYQ